MQNRSVCLSIFLSLSISMFLFLSLYRNCPFISLPFFLSFCLFVLMCFCLAASLPFHLCVFLSLYLLSLSMSPICISLLSVFFQNLFCFLRRIFSSRIREGVEHGEEDVDGLGLAAAREDVGGN